MDELRPDTGDRHPSRSRKISAVPKIPISRQHMMMGIGILVLLLLVLAIGSALRSMDENDAQSALQQPHFSHKTRNSNDNHTNISGSKKSAHLSTPPIEESGQLATVEQSGSTSSAGSQDVVSSMTSISPKQTKAQIVRIPENQQRIELPSHLNNTLSNQNSQSVTSTISGPSADVETPGQVSSNPVVVDAHQTSRDNNAATIYKSPLKPAVKKASGSIPTKNFTLQLSSAARPDTLNAWAKKQNLSDYHVYQTTRNGQPWYVLVSGSYVTSDEAKRAMALLPHEVRAQNPWVKPFKVKEAGK